MGGDVIDIENAAKAIEWAPRQRAAALQSFKRNGGQ